MKYRNPVLPGFHPDPSIVRVGEDYFIVNSTFQYFPAIPISHSTDLVHWRTIGHVFAEPGSIDLGNFFDGCGVWAPDISYHDGWFYVFYCLVQLKRDRSVNVRGNYMVRARHVLGPYSEPVRLTDEGNDPSHFVDSDGTHYMLYAAGTPLGRGTKIVRLSDDCSRVVGTPQWMNWGTDRRAPEGPHVFKRGEFYYHTMAAGSGLYDGHHQLIARSRSLFGPYEQNPNDPFIAQRDPLSPYQHHGHAKLFEDAAGSWWAAYLMQRRIEGCSPLGRETGIDPVTWTDDGWPVLNGGAGPLEEVRLPASRSIQSKKAIALPAHRRVNGFGPEWLFVRSFDAQAFQNDSCSGAISIRPSEYSMADRRCNTVALRREVSHHYSASCRVAFDSSGGGRAGLVCYYDTASHVVWCVTGSTERHLKLLVTESGREAEIKSIRMALSAVYLRIDVDGLRRVFSYSANGQDWAEAATIESATFLSDEGTPEWGFTGTLLGLFADSGTTLSETAVFTGFQMSVIGSDKAAPVVADEELAAVAEV